MHIYTVFNNTLKTNYKFWKQQTANIIVFAFVYQEYYEYLIIFTYLHYSTGIEVNLYLHLGI